MKKLTIIFALLLFFTSIYAQKDSSSTPILDKTEHLVDKYNSKIADAFISTIDRATPMAKEGFKAVVWLQIAEGIASLLPLLFFIIFMLLFVREYNNVDAILKSDKVPEHMNRHYGPFESDNMNPKLIIYMILSIILFIGALFTTFDGITHLVAPKWFAIKEVIELIK